MISDINFDGLPLDIKKSFTCMALSARAAQRLNMSQDEFVEFAKECWISVEMNGDNIEDAIAGWCAKEIKDKFDIQFN